MLTPVFIPGLLRDCTGGRATVEVEGATLAEAIASLLGAFPLLRVHLFDEQMHLRKHVLIFHNDENTKRLLSLDVALKDGDRLTVIQAVSGGTTGKVRGGGFLGSASADGLPADRRKPAR